MTTTNTTDYTTDAWQKYREVELFNESRTFTADEAKELGIDFSGLEGGADYQFVVNPSGIDNQIITPTGETIGFTEWQAQQQELYDLYQEYEPTLQEFQTDTGGYNVQSLIDAIDAGVPVSAIQGIFGEEAYTSALATQSLNEIIANQEAAFAAYETGFAAIKEKYPGFNIADPNFLKEVSELRAAVTAQYGITPEDYENNNMLTRLDELQTKYDTEANPLKKVSLFAQISTLKGQILDNQLPTTVRYALLGEDNVTTMLANTGLDTGNPLDSILQLRELAVTDNTIDLNLLTGWVEGNEYSDDAKQVMRLAFPELSKLDTDQIFSGLEALEHTEEVLFRMNALPDIFDEDERNIEWLSNNIDEAVDRLIDYGYSGHTAILMQEIYPSATANEIYDILHKEEDKRNFAAKFWGQMVSGTHQMIAAIGGGREAVSQGLSNWADEIHTFGVLLDWQATNWGIGNEQMIEYGLETSENYRVEGGGIGWDLAETIPLQLVLLVTSMGVGNVASGLAANAGLSPLKTFLIQAGAMGVTSRTGESFVEMGNTWIQAKEQGLTDEEAARAAMHTFTGQAPLAGGDVLQYAIMLAAFSKIKLPVSLTTKGLAVPKKIGGFTVNALTEGGEEYYQEIVQRQALGEDISAWALEENLSDEDIRYVTFLGFLSGGIFQSGAEVLGVVNSTTVRNLPGKLKGKVIDSIANYASQGDPIIVAETKAINDNFNESGMQEVYTGALKVGEIHSAANQIQATDTVRIEGLNYHFNSQIEATGLDAPLVDVTVQEQESPVISQLKSNLPTTNELGTAMAITPDGEGLLNPNVNKTSTHDTGLDLPSTQDWVNAGVVRLHHAGGESLNIQINLDKGITKSQLDRLASEAGASKYVYIDYTDTDGKAIVSYEGSPADMVQALTEQYNSRAQSVEAITEVFEPQIEPKASKQTFQSIKAKHRADMAKLRETERSKRINAKAKAAEKAKLIKSLKQELTNFTRDYLPVSERGKLITQIKDVSTTEQLSKALDKVARVHEQYLQKTLHTSITKELAKVKEKGNKYPHSNTDADALSILQQFKNNYKGDHAINRQQIIDNELAAQSGEITIEEAASRNEVLRVTNLDGATSEELQYALDSIQSIAISGKTARQEYIVEKARVNEQARNAIQSELSGGEGLAPGTGTVNRTQFHKAKHTVDNFINRNMSLYRLLNKLGEKSGKAIYENTAYQWTAEKVHDSMNAESAGRAKYISQVRNKFQEIYGKKKANKVYGERAKVQNLGTFKNADGIEVELNLSRGQATKVLMNMLDDTVEPTYYNTMRWTTEMTQAVYNFIYSNPQDVAWLEFQMEFYQEYGLTIDAVYAPLYGVHIAENPNYSPISRNVENPVDEIALFFKERSDYASARNSSLKTRQMTQSELSFTNADDVLLNHIHQMEHFKAYAESMSDIRSVFNRDTMEMIRQQHGEDMAKVISQYFNDITNGAVKDARVHGWMNRVRVNLTTAMLSSPIVGIKQVFSGLAWSAYMPTGDYIRYSGEFWAGNPLAKAKEMIDKSPYLQSRFKEGYERDVKYMMTKNPKDALSGKTRIREYFLYHIRYGDRFGILPGFYAKYQSELAQGKTDTQAIRAAELTVELSQPSSSIQSLTSYQNGGPLYKLMTMFTTQPLKYFGMVEENAHVLAGKRPGNQAKALSNIALAWVILPAIFQWASDAFRWDEQSREHLIRAGALGPFDSLFIVGGLAETLANHAYGENWDYRFSPVMSFIDDGIRAGDDFFDIFDEGEITMEALEEFTESFIKVLGEGFGLPTRYALQVERAIRDEHYWELLFSRYALQSYDETKPTPKPTMRDKLDEADTKLLADEWYLSDYYSDFRQAIGNTSLNDITEANGFSSMEIAASKAVLYDHTVNSRPSVAPYTLSDGTIGEFPYEYYQGLYKTYQSMINNKYLDKEDPNYVSVDEIALWTRNNPDYKLGAYSQRIYDLLSQYEASDNKEQFLTDHPELKTSPREQYLIDNPKQNAYLAMFGKADIKTEKAYNMLIDLMDTIGVSDSDVQGVPPRDIAPNYFDFKDIIAEHGAGSSEALLYRLDNPNFDEWAMEPGNMNADGYAPVDDIRGVLEINVNYAEQFDLYNGYGTRGNDNYIADEAERAALRQQLLYNPDGSWTDFHTAKKTKEAYLDGITEELLPEYLEYEQIPQKGYRNERYLLEHQDLYDWMRSTDRSNPILDIDPDIPPARYDDLYDEYETDFARIEGFSDPKSEFYIADEDSRKAARDAMRWAYDEDGNRIATDFHKAELEREALLKKIPDPYIQEYIDYYSLSSDTLQKEYLRTHPEFYQDVYLGLLGHEPVAYASRSYLDTLEDQGLLNEWLKLIYR